MAYVCLDHNDNGDDGGMEKEKKIRSRKNTLIINIVFLVCVS